MKVVNLTPHEINLYEGDNIVATFPPSGSVARVDMVRAPQGFIRISEWEDSHPGAAHLLVQIHHENVNMVEGLPEPKEGTIYLVSRVVLAAVPQERIDVFCPDTGPTAVRDENGQIAGVRGFVG